MGSGRVFIAGAAGAIGWPLCRLLLAEGFEIAGTTRSAERAESLRTIGVTPVVVDVFDAAALSRVMIAARPDFVIHQLTDLPPALDPTRMAAAVLRNARLREEGTRNLVAGAIASGASRLVAQSIAFAYAPGLQPLPESAPLDLDPKSPMANTVRAVASLERQVLGAPMPGVVLRYGRLYGPGTGFDDNDKPAPLHVDAAASAAYFALGRGAGIYNVAEDDGVVDVTRAHADLGWDAGFRLA
jgi:nucleoside-diphosphate-sugar epimerase